MMIWVDLSYDFRAFDFLQQQKKTINNLDRTLDNPLLSLLLLCRQCAVRVECMRHVLTRMHVSQAVNFIIHAVLYHDSWIDSEFPCICLINSYWMRCKTMSNVIVSDCIDLFWPEEMLSIEAKLSIWLQTNARFSIIVMLANVLTWTSVIDYVFPSVLHWIIDRSVLYIVGRQESRQTNREKKSGQKTYVCTIRWNKFQWIGFTFVFSAVLCSFNQ